MMMHTIYKGEFVSRGDNSLWTVSIQQALASAPSVTGKLEFPGREPLLIEWDETSKEDVICGSTVTLKIISPGDRTYAGLYTTKAGSIGIRIEREGRLYWMGTLDPEFYEEPYTDNEDYEVELTFSDFGILERLPYSGQEGLVRISDVLFDAMERSCLSSLGYEELVSTSLENGHGPMQLSDVSVRSDNFTDEDGEVSSLRSAIEGMLQPLGLRMVQRGGKIWVYDLNGLYQGAGTEKIMWHDADQVMGVDKVANNVKVTFSPYGGSEVLSHEIGYLGAVDPDATNIAANSVYNMKRHYFTYYPDWSFAKYGGERTYFDFTIFESDSDDDGVGVHLGPAASFFHIEPVYGGESHDGVAWGFMTGGPENRYPAVNALSGKDLGGSNYPYRGREVVLRSYRVYVPRLSQSDGSRFLLRLALDVLFDVRYNPFEEGNGDNNSSACDWVRERCGYVMVPVSVNLYSSPSAPVAFMHWTNGSVYGGSSAAPVSDAANDLCGRWEPGADSSGAGWLSWYDPDDRNHAPACQGWRKNRINCGLSAADLPRRITSMEEGQLLPYPEAGGWIEVTVHSDIRCYDFPGGGKACTDYTEEFLQRLRWQLYKAPTIELVRNSRKYEAIEADDVEYSGVLDPSARDAIEIDTICGTLSEVIPTAKGVLFDTASGEPLRVLSRAGRTCQAEQLLAGSLYSQFAERHTRLTGTAVLMGGGLKLYTDGMQGSKKFMVLGDVQDVDAGTSEMTVVELSPDEYDGVAFLKGLNKD